MLVLQFLLSLIQILVPEVVPEEQNLKDEFSELVLEILELFLWSVRFKDTKTIFSSKKSTDSP